MATVTPDAQSSAQSAPPTIPTTFLRFNDLAAELQDGIWTMALPEGRIVEIRSGASNKGAQTLGRTELDKALVPHAFVSSTPRPAMLYTCKGSRTIAQKHYKLSFGCEKVGIPSMIYFDSRVDTLYLGSSSDETHTDNGFSFTTDDFKKLAWDRVKNSRVERFGAAEVKRVVLSAGHFLYYGDLTYSRTSRDSLTQLKGNAFSKLAMYFQSKALRGVKEIYIAADGEVLKDSHFHPQQFLLTHNSTLLVIEEANLEEAFPVPYHDEGRGAKQWVDEILLPLVGDWERCWKQLDARQDQSFIPSMKVVKVVNSGAFPPVSLIARTYRTVGIHWP